MMDPLDSPALSTVIWSAVTVALLVWISTGCGIVWHGRFALYFTTLLPSMVLLVLAGTGSIYLVGSGPGDPELLTLAAYRRLQDPSALVVADRLVSPEILELVRGEVRIARKLPGCAEAAQTEIYEWCEEALRSGRDVVRLKIGDPFVFGRGGEEVLYFRSAVGVEPVVIPGVSAALAAPLLGGIPVTHRGVSSQVVTCTGYGRNGTSPDLIRYHPEQTVVFLMAVGRLRELCANLQRQAGYPADTPVAIVERAGCPQQRTLVGDMTDIADLAETHTLKPPCTIVVGGGSQGVVGDHHHHRRRRRSLLSPSPRSHPAHQRTRRGGRTFLTKKATVAIYTIVSNCSVHYLKYYTTQDMTRHCMTQPSLSKIRSTLSHEIIFTLVFILLFMSEFLNFS